MSENLRTTKFNNGDSLNLLWDNQFGSEYMYSPNYYAYKNDLNLVDTIGYLYSRNVAYPENEEQNICPIGSHLPSKSDWETLIEYIGGSDKAVKLLHKNSNKCIETINNHDTGVSIDSTNRINESGFSALLTGIIGQNCIPIGSCYDCYSTRFWISNSSDDPEVTVIKYNLVEAGSPVSYEGHRNGYSIRCLKD